MKTLKYSFIAGILSLIFTIPYIIFTIFDELHRLPSNLISLFIFTILLTLFVSIAFLNGFRVLGKLNNNNLLTNFSLILIISALIFEIYKLFTLISPSLRYEIVNEISLSVNGVLSIPFGIGLIRLKEKYGKLFQIAGILDVISGIFFIIPIYSFIGLFSYFISYILKIICLHFAYKKERSTN